MLQIASLECTKEAGFETPPKNAIACALKEPCSGNKEFENRHGQVAESLETNDQCPVQDENLPGTLDLSSQEDYQSTPSHSQSICSSISIDDQTGGKVDSLIGISISWRSFFLFSEWSSSCAEISEVLVIVCRKACPMGCLWRKHVGYSHIRLSTFKAI